MHHMKSGPIICGTDFTENSHAAATAALALAKCVGADLRLIHASAVPSASNNAERMSAAVQRLDASPYQILSDIVAGKPDEVLAEAAQSFSARLVVVYSMSRGSDERWLIGSVAERTAESSPVPTLVVRNPAPFIAWAMGERALKVMVATDFSLTADASLNWVAELRAFGQIDVVAAYVGWPPEEASRLGVEGPIGMDGTRPDIQIVLERDLREKVSRKLGDHGVRIRVEVNWGSVDTALVKMAREEQADLIVVGTHQWRGLKWVRHGSVSRGVLRHAPMSVACVPAPEAGRMSGPYARECRRVLVAVDLDEPHGFAAPHGYSIVQPGGVVRLIYNTEPVRPTYPLMGEKYQDHLSSEEYTQHIARTEARLRALVPAPADARGVITEVEVTEGRRAAEAICAAAERFGADVICIGAHTRPGLMAKILGSVSQSILQLSRRPVLVVWPPAP